MPTVRYVGAEERGTVLPTCLPNDEASFVAKLSGELRKHYLLTQTKKTSGFCLVAYVHAAPETTGASSAGPKAKEKPNPKPTLHRSGHYEDKDRDEVNISL